MLKIIINDIKEKMKNEEYKFNMAMSIVFSISFVLFLICLPNRFSLITYIIASLICSAVVTILIALLSLIIIYIIKKIKIINEYLIDVKKRSNEIKDEK